MEQLVARRAHNPKVGGSSPPPRYFENQAVTKKWLPFFMHSVQHMYNKMALSFDLVGGGKSLSSPYNLFFEGFFIKWLGDNLTEMLKKSL